MTWTNCLLVGIGVLLYGGLDLIVGKLKAISDTLDIIAENTRRDD